MELVTWREGYETGIEQMDTQHKTLIKIINKIYQAIRNQEEYENIESILLEMNDYANEHLLAEETLLEEHGYIDLDDHKASHDTYRSKIKELQTEFTNNKDATQQIYHFLRTWWINHIIEEDKQYGSFLSKKGVQ